MGWRERDLARPILTVLIFMLMIYESAGSSSEIILSHNGLYAPSNSPSHPPKGRTAHNSEPVQATSPIGHTVGRIGGNLVSSPSSLPPPPSHHSGSLLPLMSFQAPLVSEALPSQTQNSKKKENHSPHHIFQEPTMPPLHASLPFIGNNGKGYTSPPYYEYHEISPSSKTTIALSKSKRRHVAPPNFGGYKMNPSVSHASVSSPKYNRPYAEGPKTNPAPVSPPMKTKRSNRVHHTPPLFPQGQRTTDSSEPAPSSSITEHKRERARGNPDSSPFSLSPTPSQNLASLLPSTPFQAPLDMQAIVSPTQNSKKRDNYSPHSNIQEPIMSSFQPSSPFTRNNGRHFAPPPYYEDQVISPPGTPITMSKSKRRHLAPPPNFGGFETNPSASHASVPTSKPKSPYAKDSEINPAPSSSPTKTERSDKWDHAPSTSPQGLHLPPLQAPLSSSVGETSAAPLPAPTSPPAYITWQINSPEPSTTSQGKSWAPSPQPKRALPPPPPNLDCGPMMCQPPLTNPSPGSPCSCVLPIKIGLRLGVDLYTFFPLVSELAKEIAAGTSMKQSQVRIMGANSATEDPEKTDVLIDLVPLGKTFDNTTVFLTFKKFWQRHVSIQELYFGDYVVLYVVYPGLPPSPPSPAYVDGQAYHSDNYGRKIHPLGVDVRKQKKKHSGSLIAIVTVSSVLALFSIIGAAWLLILRKKKLTSLPAPNFQSSQHPLGKSSAAGTIPMNVRNRPSSLSASFRSNLATYAGSIKTFTLAEMEKTTSMFDDSRIIGEGGFGRVYEGILEDGTIVAIKVLKREDPQGEREFFAEVDMLSRLHHRNLVKLIGICAEENIRCLVYELVPNGSVESHIHDVKNGTPPLDWNSRVKIALGTARALAYLHEDSSPRVIHRDLKSSNILLEHDFTPKVSDFGLARSALDEGKEPISTRVMGTFGYVDPEYAMTGHLLVKSDVYSYGVVLLELLTGRKPVEMSQPPGQENLVTWTRHLLTNLEGLKTIIDPALGADYPRDSVAKVAAIASMCVQPEVSNRPLMSEVVQALKLVCHESDDHKQSGRVSLDKVSIGDLEAGIGEELDQRLGRRRFEVDGLCASSRFTIDSSGSYRGYSSSGPLRNGRSSLLWQRVRGLVSGSSSEHGFRHRFWSNRRLGESLS